MNDDGTLGSLAIDDFVGVSETDALRDVVGLLAREGTERAVVLRGEEPVGLVTARAILERVVLEGAVPDVPVSEIMGPPPPVLEPSAGVSAAVSSLANADVDVVVVADGEVHGTVSSRDVLTARAARPPSADGSADGAAARASTFDEQGICEACGSLSGTLSTVNGRLLCPDCQTV